MTDAERKFVKSEAREREQSWHIGRCEALCPPRWYDPVLPPAYAGPAGAHRCSFRGSELIDGHWVCGTHARSMRRDRPPQ